MKLNDAFGQASRNMAVMRQNISAQALMSKLPQPAADVARIQRPDKQQIPKIGTVIARWCFDIMLMYILDQWNDIS